MGKRRTRVTVDIDVTYPSGKVLARRYQLLPADAAHGQARAHHLVGHTTYTVWQLEMPTRYGWYGCDCVAYRRDPGAWCKHIEAMVASGVLESADRLDEKLAGF
jgi:hypothetical protein